MIPDPRALIAKNYSVYTFGSIADVSLLKKRLAVPSSFLIDKQGTIVWRYIGARKDRPSIKSLTDALDNKLKNPK